MSTNKRDKPRSSEPGVLPILVMLVLFIGGLIGVHLMVDSGIGRQLADLFIIVMFFGGTLMWINR